MIKNAIKTTPNDLKLLLKFKTSLIPITRAAKIQNWVKNTIGITKSGITAKNLNKPGACAKPTVTKTFLKFDSVPGSGNIFIPITKTSNCKTFFQISFSTDSGNKSFEWLCEENKNIIRGKGLDWDGMDGTAPKQLGNIIGKYLIGNPMPIVPGM